MASIEQRIPIRLTVNGQQVEGQVEPRQHLVDFLRQTLGLTGTHVGCEVGVCGACTVLLNGRTARSCLTFAAQVDGAEIRTVEGLCQDGNLSPLQESFNRCHGLQCGFCTPGMLVTATELLARDAAPTREVIREAISGNLCRCTGYETIIDAVQATAQENKTP